MKQIASYEPDFRELSSIMAGSLLIGASMTTKHCLPKNRGKVKNLSILMVSSHTSCLKNWL